MNLPPVLPDADRGMVRLPPNGTTVTAEELRNQLVCAAEFGTATVIDGSAVQTIGQAVLQLLVSARRGAAIENKTCDIVDASTALLTAAAACRLAGEIGLDTGKAPTL